MLNIKIRQQSQHTDHTSDGMKHSYHADLLERFQLPNSPYHEFLSCDSTRTTLRG